MKTLNNYFFGQDTVSGSDSIWFYGSMVFIVLVMVLVAVISR